MSATDVTEFFLSHRGRCFEAWKAENIEPYVLVNIVRKHVFAARNSVGGIGIVAIAWLKNAANILADDAEGFSQFSWGFYPKNGDSILIADVAGDRKLMPEILKQVMAHWPDSPRKKLFTYRRGKLVELSWQTVMRFTYGKLAVHS